MREWMGTAESMLEWMEEKTSSGLTVLCYVRPRKHPPAAVSSHVKRANGTVFLDVVKLPDSSWGQSEEDQRKFTYWGYNFESFCTKTAAGAQRKDVNPDVEWCAVMKSSMARRISGL
ncbi:hypothetical protein T484DRAFT_1772721 [Baffinella frigidus]|nr:hypothetical protein T484DRAFT_1772721 [Cryptophyta sp. CCMP2293]